MVTLQPVTFHERTQLGELLVTYLSELSTYDPDYPLIQTATDYPYFDAYWPESRANTAFEGEERHPFFIQAASNVIGFTLIRANDGYDSRVWQVAEFYIKPSHRKTGYGKAAFKTICTQYGPDWELQALTSNTAAVRFWDAAIAANAKRLRKTQTTPLFWHYTFSV